MNKHIKLQKREFENILTVAELKKIIADWPETNDSGELCEVWIGIGDSLSVPVRAVWPLNYRASTDGMKNWADLLLDSER